MRNHPSSTTVLQLTWLEFVFIESPAKHFRWVVLGGVDLVLVLLFVCCRCLSSIHSQKQARDEHEKQDLERLAFFEAKQGIVDVPE